MVKPCSVLASEKRTPPNALLRHTYGEVDGMQPLEADTADVI